MLAQCDADREAKPFLLLGEPIAGLDLAHQHVALASARRCAHRGAGVLAVLHDLTMAAQCADRVAVLDGGNLAALGPVDDVLEPEAPSRIFATPIPRLQAGTTTAYFSPAH